MKLLFCIFIVANIFGSNEKTILFIGDSLTIGYRVDSKESYPYLVQQKLKKNGHKVKIINASVSGSTSASGLSRLKWNLKVRPDILFLALGANDGLRGTSLSGTKGNLAKVIKLAKDSGLKVILAGMRLPPNYGQEYGKKFEKMFKELKKEYKIELVPFLLEKVGGEPSLNQADGIHPNPKGYKVVAENVYPYILKAL